MIEVIQENTKGQHYCFKCGTLFSYGKEDVKSESVHIDAYTAVLIKCAIHCPICNAVYDLK